MKESELHVRLLSTSHAHSRRSVRAAQFASLRFARSSVCQVRDAHVQAGNHASLRFARLKSRDQVAPYSFAPPLMSASAHVRAAQVRVSPGRAPTGCARAHVRAAQPRLCQFSPSRFAPSSSPPLQDRRIKACPAALRLQVAPSGSSQTCRMLPINERIAGRAGCVTGVAPMRSQTVARICGALRTWLNSEKVIPFVVTQLYKIWRA